MQSSHEHCTSGWGIPDKSGIFRSLFFCPLSPFVSSREGQIFSKWFRGRAWLRCWSPRDHVKPAVRGATDHVPTCCSSVSVPLVWHPSFMLSRAQSLIFFWQNQSKINRHHVRMTWHSYFVVETAGRVLYVQHFKTLRLSDWSYKLLYVLLRRKPK